MAQRSQIPLTLGATIAVLAAIVARHAGDSKQVPVFVVAATLIAIVGAAISFPVPAPRTLILERSFEPTRPAGPAALVFLLPAVAAVLIWRTEPFALFHQFVKSSSTGAAVLWLGGLVAGLAMLWDRWHGQPRVGGFVTAIKRPDTRWVMAILIVILIVGAVVRLWHLSSLPEGIWSDEADSAADAVRLLHAPFQPFAPGNYGHNPALYFYAMAALIRAGGETIWMARLTSALFGIASIAAAFAVGYQVRGAVLALYAASLMAMAQWAITFSRVAMPNIPIPAITGLGYATFMIAMHRPRPFWFALSGTLLGLSFLTYPGAYLPAVIPLLLVYARSRSDPAFARASRHGRLFLPLCLLVSAAPMLTTLFLDGNYVLGRVHVTSLFNEYHDTARRILGLLDNIRSYTLMFTVQGDHNGRHNLSGSPMLDPITGVLFLLGLGICLRQWRQWQYQTLLLWLASNLLSGILSLESEAPHGARTLGALVPVVVIAAMPLLYLRPVVQSTLDRLGTHRAVEQQVGPKPASRDAGRKDTSIVSARISAGLASALLLGALILNLNQYFGEQARSLRSWRDMGGQVTTMARSIARLNREGAHVYTDPTKMNDIVVQLVAPDWKPQAYNASHPFSDLAKSGQIAFVIPVQSVPLVRRLRSGISDVRVIAITPAFNQRIIEGCVVSWQARPVASTRRKGG